MTGLCEAGNPDGSLRRENIPKLSRAGCRFLIPVPNKIRWGEGAAAAAVTKAGEDVGIALAAGDGVDDGQGALAVDVAEDVLQFQVHLGEALPHELELASAVPGHFPPVPHEKAQGHDVAGGPEGFFGGVPRR